mmetsp:Transcript_36741/g.116974  ORF Transcript_36741/g.116974 Transcript_36741/m.116974 type:complete len:282 (-) Transcript_36741:235-1080(-)
MVSCFMRFLLLGGGTGSSVLAVAESGPCSAENGRTTKSGTLRSSPRRAGASPPSHPALPVRVSGPRLPCDAFTLGPAETGRGGAVSSVGWISIGPPTTSEGGRGIRRVGAALCGRAGRLPPAPALVVGRAGRATGASNECSQCGVYGAPHAAIAPSGTGSCSRRASNRRSSSFSIRRTCASSAAAWSSKNIASSGSSSAPGDGSARAASAASTATAFGSASCSASATLTTAAIAAAATAFAVAIASSTISGSTIDSATAMASSTALASKAASASASTLANS